MDSCKCKKCPQKPDECIEFIKDLERFLKDSEYFFSKCEGVCPVGKQLSDRSKELLEKVQKVKSIPEKIHKK